MLNQHNTSHRIIDNTMTHRRTGQFFLGGGLRHLCSKNFSTAPEKTAMLTCKITVPNSPYPIVKIPDFGHYLARWDEFHFSFNKYIINTFCPKNLAFARKIMALPKSEGLQPSSPLARTPMQWSDNLPRVSSSYHHYLVGPQIDQKF